MTIDEAFRALILSSTDVSNTIATRLHPGSNTIDLTTGLPKAVYTLFDDNSEYCDDGLVGIERALYQIDAFAQHQEDASALMDAIQAKLDDASIYPHTNNDIQIIRIFRRPRKHSTAQKQTGADTGPKRVTREFLVIYRET